MIARQTLMLSLRYFSQRTPFVFQRQMLPESPGGEKTTIIELGVRDGLRSMDTRIRSCRGISSLNRASIESDRKWRK